jgi:hypothetical protein
MRTEKLEKVLEKVARPRQRKRFHIEKDKIERALGRLAAKLDTAPRVRNDKEARRVVVTTGIIGGRRIMVQKPRASFAIFVGTPKPSAATRAQ